MEGHDEPAAGIPARWLKQALEDVRDAATALVDETEDDLDDAAADEARKVRNACDIALTLLQPGRYLPKPEAVEDVRAMLDWYDTIQANQNAT